MSINPFTAVVESNAFYPWKHAPEFFCKCTSCHAYRARRILSKCDLLDTALDALEADDGRLEWPMPACELPAPDVAITSNTPTIRPCPRKWGHVYGDTNAAE